MKKRGSHVGIILSFVIFVTFVSFLYLVFKPAIRFEQNKEIALDFLEKEIVDLCTDELAFISIKILSYDFQSSCLSMPSQENFENYMYVLVKSEGKIVNSSKGSSLEFEIPENLNLTKIYYSNSSLSQTLFSETECSNFTKETGQVVTKKYLFESKILDLMGNESLLQEIEKSINNEFDFGFTNYSGQTIWAKNSGETSSGTYVKNIPIEYVDEEANINSGYINLKIW